MTAGSHPDVSWTDIAVHQAGLLQGVQCVDNVPGNPAGIFRGQSSGVFDQLAYGLSLPQVLIGDQPKITDIKYLVNCLKGGTGDC